MKKKIRVSPLSPEIYGSSATETPINKHHRKNPHQTTTTQESIYDAETEPSQSESPPEVDENDDEQYTESESASNNIPRNQFSDFESESIREELDNITATYIAIAPLPIFRGTPDECPSTHLSRFAKVCKANNGDSIDMMMRIFPVTLENQAELWFDLNIEPYPSLNWEEIKSSFLEFFGRMEFVEQFRSELMMVRQIDEQSVRDYFLRMQWILKRWPDHGIPDGLLKGIFIGGLREDFQDWIIPQKPNSLNDALKLAFMWEQTQSMRASRQNKNMTESLEGYFKCGFCDGSHEEGRCEIRARMKDEWLKNKEDASPKKDLVRSVSEVRSSIVGKEGIEEEKEEGILSGKKSQCQCWKHQCWKKKMERNNSLVVRSSIVD